MALYVETRQVAVVSEEVAELQERLCAAEKRLSHQRQALQLVEQEYAKECSAQEEIETWKRESWAAETELTLERCQRIETAALVSMQSCECAEVLDLLTKMEDSAQLAEQTAIKAMQTYAEEEEEGKAFGF